MTIFVFGSNLRGVHGIGAAKVARDQYGAVPGTGFGRTGDAYAIPTKRFPTKAKRQLELATINVYIAGFLSYALRNPSLDFKVTRIGCGFAGYTDEEIGPRFRMAPKNCYFDPIWAEKFGLQPWKEGM